MEAHFGRIARDFGRIARDSGGIAKDFGGIARTQFWDSPWQPYFGRIWMAADVWDFGKWIIQISAIPVLKPNFGRSSRKGFPYHVPWPWHISSFSRWMFLHQIKDPQTCTVSQCFTYTCPLFIQFPYVFMTRSWNLNVSPWGCGTCEGQHCSGPGQRDTCLPVRVPRDWRWRRIFWILSGFVGFYVFQ